MRIGLAVFAVVTALVVIAPLAASRQIQTISVQESLSTDLYDDEGGTFFRRDMQF